MKLHHLALLAALTACGKHPGTYTVGSAASNVSEADLLLSKADSAWDDRVDEEKLVLALGSYATVLEKDPTNRHALERLVRGWYFHGDAFTSDTTVAVERWGKAIEYGTQCLALNEAFAKAIADGGKEKDAVAHATKDDVACLYWTATALGKWAKAQSLSKTLKFLPTVKAYISKAEELEPEYWHFGPARYWGAYYAALPSFAGQDFDKSGAYFAASIEGAPDYLGTYVLRAEFLSVPLGKVAEFDADLKRVLDADPNKDPETAPENTMEQAKAKRLIEKRSELFTKKALATGE